MNLKTFTTGLVLSFGAPWLFVVVIPSISMNNVEAVPFDEGADGKEGIYRPLRNGRIADGSKIYAANGCYTCHTQVIRTTRAGSDVWREDWAGVPASKENPVDTRRETNVFDYQGEDFAQIGLTRTGPDLSNVGLRIDSYAAEEGISPEAWIYRHLYNPNQGDRWKSVCPAQEHLFEPVNECGQGPDADKAVYCDESEKTLVPKPEAEALASYILSLKKNDLVPYSMNYRGDKKRADAQ